MEKFSFYVVIETTTGKTYKSDVEGIKEHVQRVFMTPANIPIEGCWDKVQHYVDSMSMFRRDSQKIYMTIGGNMTYFNPDHVLSIALVRV